MMRWTPSTTTDVSEVSEDNVVREFLASVVGAVAGMGGRSVVVAVMVALIVLTLVFGVSTEDALAGGNWCPRC
jgi:hypothetical protein